MFASSHNLFLKLLGITQLQSATAAIGRIFEFWKKKIWTTSQLRQLNWQILKGQIVFDHVSILLRKTIIHDFQQLLLSQVKRLRLLVRQVLVKTTIVNLLTDFYNIDRSYHHWRWIRTTGVRLFMTNFSMVLPGHLALYQKVLFMIIWFTTKKISLKGKLLLQPRLSVFTTLSPHFQKVMTLIWMILWRISWSETALDYCTCRFLRMPSSYLGWSGTSSVDTRTEELIQKPWTNLWKVGLLCHCSPLIQPFNADLITVMKDGNIIEQGNHDELMAADGFLCWSL